MPIVEARELTKHFRVGVKQAGLMGTLKHFVRRQYRTIEAVKAVSFAIEPGEIVGFLGPNGAGKTTTLKMLTGLIHPTRGFVEVAGHTPFDRRSEFLRRITLVMGQKQQLVWDLPTSDGLRINAAVYDVPDDLAKRRVDELSEMLEIRDALEQPIRKLSLGQRMKAELLAALLHHPDVLFLDEPTLGLDINAQATVRQFLRDYNERYEATILMTSHYMADITALCPRVMLIHEGSLIHDGDLDGLLQRFAPRRELRIEFAESVDFARLEDFGEVESADDRVAMLLVPRAELTATVDRVLDEFEVMDLTVTDPPIERIIGRLFHRGRAAVEEAAS